MDVFILFHPQETLLFGTWGHPQCLLIHIEEITEISACTCGHCTRLQYGKQWMKKEGWALSKQIEKQPYLTPNPEDPILCTWLYMVSGAVVTHNLIWSWIKPHSTQGDGPLFHRYELKKVVLPR